MNDTPNYHCKPDGEQTPKKEWVLMKRGFFYRPNEQGYTDRIRDAGLYTKEEAEKHICPFDEPVTMHLASKFIGNDRDVVSGKMFDDMVEQRDAVKHELSLLKAVAFKYAKALEIILMKSMPTTADSGDSGIHAIAEEAVKLRASMTWSEYTRNVENEVRGVRATIENSHREIDSANVIMNRDKSHQGLVPRIKSMIAHYKRQLGNKEFEIKWLKREVEVLRSYGNKDCTGMADAVLDSERNGTPVIPPGNYTLQPISTAPKDGTYILLFGPSGYGTNPWRCEVCRYDAKYRPLQPWVNHANDSFMDGGEAPTHWLPMPNPKKSTIKIQDLPARKDDDGLGAGELSGGAS